ncbi:MAG: hypothetical protein AAF735_07550 [Myxococcota bacterium]
MIDPLPKLSVVSGVDVLAAGFSLLRGNKELIVGQEAQDEIEEKLVDSGLVVRLAREGFVSFVVVGPKSESVHDAIDDEQESHDLLGPLTTWHDDDEPEDIASLIVVSARSQALAELVFIVDDRHDADRRLKAELQAALRGSGN